MSPYKMVYGKACHLPLELEHKTFWAVRELNAETKLAGEKRLMNLTSLDECNIPKLSEFWNVNKLNNID